MFSPVVVPVSGVAALGLCAAVLAWIAYDFSGRVRHAVIAVAFGIAAILEGFRAAAMAAGYAGNASSTLLRAWVASAWVGPLVLGLGALAAVGLPAIDASPTERARGVWRALVLGLVGLALGALWLRAGAMGAASDGTISDATAWMTIGSTASMGLAAALLVHSQTWRHDPLDRGLAIGLVVAVAAIVFGASAPIAAIDPPVVAATVLNASVVIGSARVVMARRADLEAAAWREKELEALPEAERLFMALAETAHEAIISCDSEGVIVFWNASAERMFGHPADDAIGRNVAIVIPADHIKAHEQGMTRLRETGESRLNGRVVPLEACHRDGRRFPVELSITAWHTVEKLFFTAIIRDVSDSRHVEGELRVLATRLEFSNNELQAFAQVASHDLQEPLRKILTFSDRLTSRFGDQLGPEGVDYVDRMGAAAKRMQRLVADVLELSLLDASDVGVASIDLAGVLDEVAIDLELRIAESGARLDVGPLPHVSGDRAQMYRLFLNLIGNALKFRRADVPPLVTVRAVDEPSDDPARPPVRIDVSDNGIGLDARYAERIFQPFQRLHGRNAYEGSGIGLAICRRIVERHHGTISAASQPGRGTTFVVRLPRTHLDATS